MTGIDADSFNIDARGMLMFNRPPNYEMPGDKPHDQLNLNGDDDTEDPGEFAAADTADNVYRITVRATEQETSGDDHRALSTETEITVVVTDVAEDGSLVLDLLEPEVGTRIVAQLDDPDGIEDTITWTWHTSKVSNPVIDAPGHWNAVAGTLVSGTVINVPNASSYVPQGECADEKEDANCTPNPPASSPIDEGKYLRATATYSVNLNDGDNESAEEKTVHIMSDNPVRAEVSSDLDEVENPDNGSPGFSSANDYTREVSEDLGVGMPIPDAVEATDPNGDTLTYELDNTRADVVGTDADALETSGAVGYFSIDRETGQLSVKKALNFEASLGPEYVFFVRATDPSGETAEVEVTVTVTDANDAPKIMGSDDSPFDAIPDAPSELRVDEKVGSSYDGTPDMPLRSLPGDMNVFTAADEDARGQIFWSIKGEDVDDFELTSSSPDPITGLRGPDEPIALKFKADPDFESPTDENGDSVYKVTLVARDRFTGGKMDERPLAIFVDNVAEGGNATLSEEQPLINNEVTAMVEDPDNGVAIVTWMWERSNAVGANANWAVINGATTDTYTPKENKDAALTDNGMYLRAMATYTDITSFKDDLETVRVDERTQNADATHDPEAKNPEEEGNPDRLYRVRVVSQNAVRVDPDQEDDLDAPQFAESSYTREVVENAETDTIVGYPIQAVAEVDDNDNVITEFEYSLDDSVTGDEDYFTTSISTGQIRVGSVLFPDPIPAGIVPTCDHDAGTTDIQDCPDVTDPTLDYEGDNTFELIITATDTGDSSRTVTAAVTITLENLNERPYFDKASREMASSSRTIMYSEHRTNPVIPMLAAVDPDGEALRWELTGPDASDFEIVDAQDISDGKDRVQLEFRSQPNYESGNGNATTTVPGDTYQVVVRATEENPVGVGPAVALAAELEVKIQIGNSDESGTVELNWLKPEVGTAITATRSDPDGVEGSPTWSWWRSTVTTPGTPSTATSTTRLEREWEAIEENANNVTYTPVEPGDEGKFLLARVEYTDTLGGNKVAVGVSTHTVGEDVSDDDNNSPDFNQSTTDREIDENAAVGDSVGLPVDVDRNEDGDILTYELVRSQTGTEATDTIVGDPGNPKVDTEDVEFFSINKRTGQIMVAKPLSAEETDGRPYFNDDAVLRIRTAGVYKVVVRATDPSGEPDGENRDDIVVTITANDVEEAPRVTGAAELTVCEEKDDDFVGLGFSFDENTCVMVDEVNNDDPTIRTPDEIADPNTSNVYHRQEEDVIDRETWPTPIGGPDGHLFEYSLADDGIGRKLHFMDAPDYETPMDANGDNVYEVTIMVVDGDGVTGLRGERNVGITVKNQDEEGKLVFNTEQPNDGMPVMAMVEDPDGVVSVTNWEWATTTSSIVTAFPQQVDNVDAVIAEAHMAEYTGLVGEFLWARAYYRDGASVMDDPVTALDERNDNPGGDGVLGTADDGATQDDYPSDNTVEAGTANAVQPEPDDGDDGMMPDTEVVEMTRMVYENVPSTGYVGAPILGLMVKDTNGREIANRTDIGGPDGDTFVFAEDEDGDASTYYDAVLAPASPLVDASDKVGQLALAPVTHLNYEAGKNTYTIEISDPTADIEVSVFRITINVMDVNEAPTAPSELKGLPPALNTAPEFAATSTTRMVAENTAAGTAIGDPVEAMDADRGDTLEYTLGGADAASFAIDSETGQLMTSAALDYETDAEYTVTVTATDSDGETDMIYVTIMVTNEGLDNAYDKDDTGDISRAEVIMAIDDFLFGDGSTTRDDVIAVIDLFLFG